ncbi:MAG: hypothetical protein AAGU17_01795 [Anaerolineaceae bacterium]
MVKNNSCRLQIQPHHTPLRIPLDEGGTHHLPLLAGAPQTRVLR